ncbi:MAG: uracil-DNA glycosylase [Clostridia bacterium]|nr:uracil-DNA glycosylase [Clostridia bacterium]
MVVLNNSWDDILKDEFAGENYQKIRKVLKYEYSHCTVYPDMYDIFNALKYTDYHDVRAVILGQDPYHGPGQAHGRAFSVQRGVPAPPSLVNIYQEIADDLGIAPPQHGCLESWAKGGVLLLNTALTVRARQANSHRDIGWEVFTDSIIKKISLFKSGVVFLLWGANARSKAKLIDKDKHLVLECAHPSPLSAYNGFFGCGHFKKTNEYLIKMGKQPIDWSVQ